jgi:hypothetical protein
MGEKKEETWKSVVSLALLPVLIPWEGFVIAKLWRWFLVPLGVPPVTISHAIGISTLTWLLTHQINLAEKKELDSLETMLIVFVRFAMALGIGWVAMKVMGQ